MTALYRYVFATVLHSQRYLPPLIFFLAMLAVPTGGDNGPLLGVYAVSAGAVLAGTTWLTAAVANVEDQVGRTIVVVNARHSARVLAATAAVAATFGAAMAAAGLAYPLVSGGHKVTARALALGAVAQLTCAAVGVGIGLLCSRPVIRRPGAAVLTGLGLVLAAVLAKPVPPVYPMLSAMTRDADHPASAMGFAGYAVAGLVVLAVAAGGAHFVAVRRD